MGQLCSFVRASDRQVHPNPQPFGYGGFEKPLLDPVAGARPPRSRQVSCSPSLNPALAVNSSSKLEHHAVAKVTALMLMLVCYWSRNPSKAGFRDMRTVLARVESSTGSRHRSEPFQFPCTEVTFFCSASVVSTLRTWHLQRRA